jgi:hypothetical protein
MIDPDNRTDGEGVMLRTLAAVLIVAMSTLIAPRSAHAIMVTLDNNALTVVRPSSGTLQVDFTGHIAVTDGYELALVSVSPLFNQSGDSLGLSLFPSFDFSGLDGVLFSLFVSSTDALGNYAFFDPSTPTLAEINWFECPIGGGLCNGSGPLHYSLNVISAAVPEPGPLALFVLSLASLIVIRRRARHWA